MEGYEELWVVELWCSFGAVESCAEFVGELLWTWGAMTNCGGIVVELERYEEVLGNCGELWRSMRSGGGLAAELWWNCGEL